ncbi:MAG: protein-S-isoprenylcysteine O-methyltransferase [Pseudomonadota bacterium]
MKILKKVLPIVIFGVVGAVIIWRAPINGWSTVIWMTGNIIMGVIRAPHEAANKANVAVESRQNATENTLLFAIFLGNPVIPAAHLMFGVFDFAAYSLPLWATGIGAAMLLLGLWMFRRSHADLGRNWNVSLEIREEHTLVTDGVYKRIRHPMYTAIFLIFAAQPLLIHNWIAGWSALIAFTAIYVVRVSREEAMMRDQFGEQYDRYCEATGRLLPKIM